MRAYDFYRYSASWDFFLDRTPLLIVLIWPVVVDSAGLLARRILGDLDRRVPLLGAAFVLADASLIEPIAVRAGLWTWTCDGIFGVPPIGIMGWSFFAVAAIAVFVANDRARRSPAADLAIFLMAPLATHALLLASWYGALRWARGTIAPWPAVAIAWGVLFSLAVFAWQRGLRRRIPASDLLVRMPGAAFFFVLLAVYGRDFAPLVVYALAFAPPYLALMKLDVRNARP